RGADRRLRPGCRDLEQQPALLAAAPAPLVQEEQEPLRPLAAGHLRRRDAARPRAAPAAPRRRPWTPLRRTGAPPAALEQRRRLHLGGLPVVPARGRRARQEGLRCRELGAARRALAAAPRQRV